MSPRRLIVSGDDFGAAPEVNDGIVRAHTDGILTSASLMVRGEAVDEAVKLAHTYPTLAVGLHLVLVQGEAAARPAEIPALASRDGRFGDRPVLAGFRYAAAWVRGVGHAQLRREIGAQLEAFRATGLPLSHVDGHCNMHLHPMVLRVLLEIAAEFGVRAVRLTHDPLGPALRWDRAHLVRKCAEASVFRVLSARARPMLEAAGMTVVDRVIGMHETGRIDESYLRATIESLPAGTSEIYCHPALGRVTTTAPFQADYRNADEVAGLTSRRVRALVEAAGIELTTYPALARTRSSAV